MKNKLADSAGFTYLMVLMLIMIMGVMLGAVGQSWKTILQREREEELLFRGQQIRDAIKKWYERPGAIQQATPLRDLKDLLQDPRSTQTVRYLRRLYMDPVTGEEWAVISDPNKGISGVASTSQDTPLKVGGFPDDLKELTGKTHYSEWQFIYRQGSSNTGGSGKGGTGTGGSGKGGTGMSGTGMSGTGMSGTGMSGTGMSGTGMSGTGMSGTGMSGTGMSGTGMSGTGMSGTGMSGTGMSGMPSKLK